MTSREMEFGLFDHGKDDEYNDVGLVEISILNLVMLGKFSPCSYISIVWRTLFMPYTEWTESHKAEHLPLYMHFTGYDKTMKKLRM